jgi:hypothetical protein
MPANSPGYAKKKNNLPVEEEVVRVLSGLLRPMAVKHQIVIAAEAGKSGMTASRPD